MKRLIIILQVFAMVACTSSREEVGSSYPAVDDNAVNFIVANDLGRNGYYEQKPIAELMGDLANNVDIEFIAAAGDVHHFNGVASVNDPLWTTNYELVYSHPELMIDWFPILGNHEYRGNTEAVLDYAKVSRRWVMPSRYYTKIVEVNDSVSARLLFIDTAPLISKYRNEFEEYPDARMQSDDAQLAWMDSVLASSTEKIKIVIGHHPVYAETKKNDSERVDLQNRVAPILEKYGVDVYFAGHIHNFQHIQPKGMTVDYVVNSSASLSRRVIPIEGTKYCNGSAGFTVCSLTNDGIEFFFINSKGETIYSYKRQK